VRVQKEYALLAQSGLIAKSGARIHPQPACLGPTTAGVEHRDRRIVGEELGGGEPGMQRLQPSTGVADGGGEAMAAGTERSHANIQPYSSLTPGLVSVTMPMAHNNSVTAAGDMRKNISKCDAPHTLLTPHNRGPCWRAHPGLLGAVRLADGIDRRSAGPVAIRVGVEHRLQIRLQVASGDLLGDTVGHRRNAQRARATVCLRNIDPPHRRRKTASRRQPVPGSA